MSSGDSSHFLTSVPLTGSKFLELSSKKDDVSLNPKSSSNYLSETGLGVTVYLWISLVGVTSGRFIILIHLYSFNNFTRCNWEPYRKNLEVNDIV